jgi:putative membrane protein
MDPTQTNQRAALGSIVVVSAAAVSFLLWLLYLHHAPAQFAGHYVFLPALNAVLNGLSAIALCTGFYLIKKRDRKAHRASMLFAFGFSSLFLVSYVVNHALHGDTRFPAGHATIRAVYLLILASHIILSVVALPLVLITFLFSLSGRFPQHKRIARYTFPIWLYVSVTGVVVFALLQAYAY